MRELEPFRRAARRWLKVHGGDTLVVRVVAKLDGMISRGGPVRKAWEVRHLSPEDKASAAMARLHAAGKRGEDLLTIVLTIAATIEAIGPRGNPEFRNVQIAKMAHRLASGTHVKGFIRPLSKYPRAEGRGMRVLGSRIEDAASLVATPEAVEEVLELVEAGRSGNATF